MSSEILLKIFSLSTIGFLFAFSVTPLLTTFLYKYKLGKQIRSDGSTPIFTKLHEGKKGTPTMGGVLIWGTLFVLAALFWVGDRALHIAFLHKFNFLTRKETLLPLGALMGAAIVGLFDDILDIKQLGYNGRGFRFRFKFILYAFVAIIGAWWFYFKLGFQVIHIPFIADWHMGWLFIPFFIFAVIGVSFSVNLSDGLDGLAGGVLLLAFFAYSIIAYSQGRENLATFLGVICGALLAFLWFNVYPARFFMGDTGSMGLGVVLAIVAFLTNTVFLLPLIGFIFMIEALSLFGQLFWRKIYKKKLLLSAPLHHHLEARGWPETKVTMRFWIIASVMNIVAVIIYYLDKKIL